ncbi:hypothetical protein BX600DRAFT_149469 [Xylariales sp. PMI_506]|nr:hypothetical protein BX600DRAFT_149469 [Xylariales sp. PMI_506]
MSPQHPEIRGAVESAADELSRRRERAKLSQRAFRKRKTAATQHMAEENKRLRAAIRDVVTASQQGNPDEIQRAIERAGAIIGASASCGGSEDILPWDPTEADLSAAGGDPAPHSSDKVSEETAEGALPSPVGSSQMTLMNLDRDSGVEGIYDLSQPFTSCTDPAWVSTDTLGRLSPDLPAFRPTRETTFMSPFADYPLFSSPTSLLRVVDPPSDILPYLGAHIDSLAAHIYWTYTEVAVTMMKRILRRGDGWQELAAHPAIRRAIANAKAEPALSNLQYMIALAEARLEFWRYGHASGDNAAAERDSGVVLYERVKPHHAARGIDPEDWLRPEGVEAMVRQWMRGAAWDRLQEMLEGSGAGSGAGSQNFGARQALETLMTRLVTDGICFGDGPRWKKDDARRHIITFARVFETV